MCEKGWGAFTSYTLRVIIISCLLRLIVASNSGCVDFCLCVRLYGHICALYGCVWVGVYAWVGVRVCRCACVGVCIFVCVRFYFKHIKHSKQCLIFTFNSKWQSLMCVSLCVCAILRYVYWTFYVTYTERISLNILNVLRYIYWTFTLHILNVLRYIYWTFYVTYIERFTLYIFYVTYIKRFTLHILNVLRYIYWTFYVTYIERFPLHILNVVAFVSTLWPQ